MKKTLLLAAALACSGAVAQEKQVWACQGIFDGTTGFSWENGKWVNSLFNERNILVTIDGSNAVIKDNGTDFHFFLCTATSSFAVNDALVSCSNGNSLFLLNPESGQAGYSRLLGAANSDREYRDSVATALYECTKF